MKAPHFWAPGGAALPRLALRPLTLPWRAAAWLRRATANPHDPGVPVICVGNLVMGGAGKTPTVRMLADWFRAHGLRPGVLSRGYGGGLSRRGATLVDASRHSAAEVGDEALLHAAHGPTVVAADRRRGAELLARHADVIVMDDGHQNPALVKALSIIVVDTAYGFGNGAVFPAGPLRESVATGLGRANAVIAIGGGSIGERLQRGPLPVLRGDLIPDRAAEVLAGRKVYAFCGIARPGKFRDTLRGIGAEIAGHRDFPDHHPFRKTEIEAVLKAAAAEKATPVTTAKDAVRLPPDQRAKVTVVEVALRLDQPESLEALLSPLLALARPSGGADAAQDG
ncbi:MAG: tetraacyldisaccharide 4'-kinase [Rhizobiales bacterium NRL2]|jgi:tetraacyldisaccharide 4'-kinase|nr:MAG: tetraacyldisaccharide 4'-kinase [Rhizobiales bacterium NRL2]